VSEFIFMLTQHDTTVSDALDVYDQLEGLDLRWVGFKDVGATPELLGRLAERIHGDGRKAVLEVVSLDLDSELSSVRTGLDVGVDLLMGGTRPDEVLPLLKGSSLLYFPFASEVEGHPSVIPGPAEAIVDRSRSRSRLRGVHGLDLLAYRFAEGDVSELMADVVREASVPVVIAGSIDSYERICAVRRSGAWAFTVGSAVFDAVFPADPSIRGQVAYVIDAANRAADTAIESPNRGGDNDV
jgi:4-hydroxythreonine-4-phosphate dehydrogenase